MTRTMEVPLERSSAPIGREHMLMYAIASMALVYAAITVLDPSRGAWGTVNILPLKYGSVILVAAGLFFAFLGGVKRSAVANPAFITLLLYCSYEIAGGVIATAYFGAELDNSFLGRGLFVLAALLGAIIASYPDRFANMRPAVRATALIVAVFGLALHLAFEAHLIFTNLTQVIHDELFVVVAGAIWISATSRRPIVKYLFAAALTFVAIATGKSTAFLLLGLFLLIIFISRGLFFERNGRQTVSAPRAMVALAVLPIGLTLASLVIREHTQVYQTDLRFYLWRIRVDQFLSSPIFGSGFTGSPLVPRPGRPDVGVPTHNDYLDVLSQGGLVALVLLGLVIYFAIRSPLLKEAVFSPRRELGYKHFFAFLFLTWLVASIGNPIFATPPMAVPTWFAIGVLCAGAGRRRQPQPKSPLAKNMKWSSRNA